MTLQTPAPKLRFVPEDLDPADAGALERLFDALGERPLATPDDVASWLLDESELMSLYHAEVARRYIRMTCHTDSEEARARYLALERDVAPRVKLRKDRLARKLLDSPALDALDPERYGVLVRSRRTEREIFRPENTELEARESELQARQQELMGSLVVLFEGREHTPQQMAPYLERQDRDLRRRAYEATLEARRPSWPELHRILDELISLRTEMARNAGFETYAPYRFKQLQRFDYGPEDCLALHDAIEHAVVPAVQRLHRDRRDRLGIDTLRPYDLEVDLEGRGPLAPFESEAELIGLARGAFERVDPRFGAEFDVLRERKLLDLMSRKGKTPGGYQYTLEDVRLPFIFANAVGTHRDVQTLLHEGGHAFHAILCRDEPLIDYRDAPIEFAETASMAMELMGLEELVDAYGKENAERARRNHLESTLRILPWIASIDAFQHWLYANPGHGHDARNARWLEIRARFAPDVDHSGYEDAAAHSWASQTHLYNHAFYYVEYAIAQVAALQVWQRYRADRRSAVEAYRRGLALGGTRPLPELFEATGTRFDLSEEMLASLVTDVERILRPGR